MPEVEQPDIALGSARTTETDTCPVPLAYLIVFAAVAFLLGAGQWPLLFMLIQRPIVHPLIIPVCFVLMAALVAWRLGLWRASWSTRIVAALICIVVTSWPVIGYVLVLACYNGPCRFS
jgi:hypothetical protein